MNAWKQLKYEHNKFLIILIIFKINLSNFMLPHILTFKYIYIGRHSHIKKA